MTTAMDDLLTAGDASRTTCVPDSTLHDRAAKRERGLSCHPRIRRWMRADVVKRLAASRF
jgi:hypothetical protein